MNRDIPTMPSLPTTAISADAPFSMTYSSETMAVVGKYTWVNVAPDSYTTWERGSSTDSRCGNQRSPTEAGSADNKKFLRRSRESMIGPPGNSRQSHSIMSTLRSNAVSRILTTLCDSVHKESGQAAGCLPNALQASDAPQRCRHNSGVNYSVSGWPLGNWCAYQVASRCLIVFSLN
jgi:hypothetical protein